MKEIKSILFDMDGVLLDTEKICIEAWKRAAEEYGINEITDIFMKCVGCNRSDTLEILKKYVSDKVDPLVFRERAGELFHEVESEQGLQKKFYAEKCLEELKSEGFILALVTSTREEVALPQLKEAGLFEYFDFFTTGDMVLHSKPAPDIYMKAMEKIGSSCVECVAVEDSPNGVKSAVAAGARCVLIPDLVVP